MAIKFGDILQNQNSAYPIVDGSNNDLKGVLFSAGLPATTDFPNKRALGTVLVDTANLKLYLYIGADLLNATWGNSNSWSEIAQGSGESIQTSNIPVAIGAGNSFGKYENGDTITVGESGWSALQIILDALTSYQAPTGDFTSGALTAIPYDDDAQLGISRTISFFVRNNNQQVVSGSNFAIASVVLQRKLSTQADTSYATVADSAGSVAAFTSGALSSLNTQQTPTDVTFTFNDTLSTTGGQEADFVYRVIVTPNDGTGSATTTLSFTGTTSDKGYVVVTNYSAPSLTAKVMSRVNTGPSTNETDDTREYGNVASKLEFKLVCNTSLVPITSFKLQRSYNNDTWTDIVTVTSLNVTGTDATARKYFDSVATSANNVTGLNTGVTGYTNVSSAIAVTDIDEARIYYRVQIVDAEQTTNVALDDIVMRWPSIVGYNSTDGSAFTSSNDATMATVLTSIRDGSGTRAQYEFIGSSDTSGDPDFTTSGGNVSVITPDGDFTWIAYPAGLNELEDFQVPGGADVIGAFNNGATLYKSLTVDFESKFGVTNSNYEVYCSNSPSAFNGTYIIR